MGAYFFQRLQRKYREIAASIKIEIVKPISAAGGGRHDSAGALERNHFGPRQRFVRGIFSQRPIQFAMGAGRTVTLDQLVDSQEIGLDTHQCNSGERVRNNQLSHAIHALH